MKNTFLMLVICLMACFGISSQNYQQYILRSDETDYVTNTLPLSAIDASITTDALPKYHWKRSDSDVSKISVMSISRNAQNPLTNPFDDSLLLSSKEYRCALLAELSEANSVVIALHIKHFQQNEMNIQQIRWNKLDVSVNGETIHLLSDENTGIWQNFAQNDSLTFTCNLIPSTLITQTNIDADFDMIIEDKEYHFTEKPMRVLISNTETSLAAVDIESAVTIKNNNLEVKSSHDIQRCLIYDVSGKLLKSISSGDIKQRTIEIPCSDISPYQLCIVEVTTKSGTATHKIVF